VARLFTALGLDLLFQKRK